ncbi:hypothetical protein ACS0TY_034101 [Phlomoides rotata]
MLSDNVNLIIDYVNGNMDSGTADQVLKPLRNRNDKGRRGWSLHEEQVLSEAMKKTMREGWKTENGFKTGYLNLLFTYMKQNTGVGLDSTTKMIEATNEQWDAFMKRDPNTRLMKSKSWPLANIDVDEASNKVWDETQDESESPSGHAQTGESNDMGKTSSGRKRKTPLPADPMVCVVQNLCDTASNRLGEIAQRIGHDQDMFTARKMIYSSVSKMNMLTLQEKLCATALIARNTEDIDVFFSLLDTDRMEWVTMLLNGDI